MPKLIRDMDLIRDLLLKIEQGEKSFNVVSDAEAVALGLATESALSREETERLEYHLYLLVDGKFVEKSEYCGGNVIVERITWSGHDFLDSIRDPVIWKKTKEGLKAGGGITVDLLKALAKGYIKKQIENHTGITLDL